MTFTVNTGIQRKLRLHYIRFTANVSLTADVVYTGTISNVTNICQVDVNTDNMHKSHLEETHVLSICYIYTQESLL